MKQAKSKKEKLEGLTEDQLLQRILASKVKSIDPNHVFQGIVSTDGSVQYKLGGKKLNPTQANLLRTEAQMIVKMQLWKIFTETLRNQAHLKLFEKMNSLEDSHFGKALLQSIVVFEQIVENIQKVQSGAPKPHQYQPQTKLSTESPQM